MANFGATQFAGGGFLPTGADGMATQKRSMGETAASSSDSLRNLTIHQLSKAQHDDFNSAQELECDGKPIKTVALVGLLVNKQMTDADITFHVYDGTGTIACRAFQDGTETAAMAQALKEGQYIQVYGNFKGALSENPNELGPITVFAFFPVEDHNQVVHHQLSAIFQHMYLEKKQAIGENAHAGGGMPAMGMGGMHAGGMPLQQQGGFAGGMNDAQAADIIYNWLKEQPETPNNDGYRQESIIAGLSGRLAPDMVLAGLKFGMLQARLYNTTDDMMFRAI